MKIYPLILAVSLIAIESCSTGSAVREGGGQHSATRPENVIVYLDVAMIDKPYDVIGMVSAEKTAGWTFTNVSDEEVINIMITKASSLGADAIVIQSIESGSKPWAVKGAGGSSSLDKKVARATAIKFK